MFTFLVGFVALIVASCAAYFSVQGLANLYAGQFLAVCIMASSLEIGKLISASFLHRYWTKTSILLKTYLIIAVLTLMGITSLGIFGFLTSAYQVSHSKIELVETKKIALESQKNNVENEINLLKERISTLNLARESQEKRLPSMSRLSAKPIYEDIAKSGEEINKMQIRIEELNQKVFESNESIVNLETEKHKSNDIGTLQFVASVFNLEVEQVVKWFTLALVIVFDPLAVCLVLAYNNIISPKVNEPESSTIMTSKVLKTVQGESKYRG